MHKVNTPFCKGVDGDNWMKWSWVGGLFGNIELAWWTLLDRFNTVFEQCRPKVSCPAYFLRGCQSREMTAISSRVAIIQDALSLIMSEASVEDCIGAAMIQSVIYNQVVLHMMANAAAILTR